MLLKQRNSLPRLVSLLAKFLIVPDKLPANLLTLFQIHQNTYATLAIPDSSIISPGWSGAADRNFYGSNASRSSVGGGDDFILPRTCPDGVG